MGYRKEHIKKYVIRQNNSCQVIIIIIIINEETGVAFRIYVRLIYNLGLNKIAQPTCAL